MNFSKNCFLIKKSKRCWELNEKTKALEIVHELVDSVVNILLFHLYHRKSRHRPINLTTESDRFLARIALQFCPFVAGSVTMFWMYAHFRLFHNSRWLWWLHGMTIVSSELWLFPWVILVVWNWKLFLKWLLKMAKQYRGHTKLTINIQADVINLIHCQENVLETFFTE